MDPAPPAALPRTGHSGKQGGRGVQWGVDETRDLIGIWGDEEVQKTLESCHRNMDVFERVAAEMRRRGHDRSAIECRTKAKGLKRDLKRCKQHNRKSGNRPKTIPFYHELDIILRNDMNVNPPPLMDSTPCMGARPSPPATSRQATNAGRVLETINEMDIRPTSPSVLAQGAASAGAVSEQMEMSAANTADASVGLLMQQGQMSQGERNDESLWEDATQIDEGGIHENELDDVAPAMQGQEAEGRGRGASPRRGAGQLAGQRGEETSPERRAILQRRRLRRVGVLADYARAMVEQGEVEAAQRVAERREFRALMEEGNRHIGNLVAQIERRVDLAEQSENRVVSVMERLLSLMELNMTPVQRGPAGVVEKAPAATAPPAPFPTTASDVVHPQRDEVMDLFQDFNFLMPGCSAAQTQGNSNVPKVFGEPAQMQESDEETDLDTCIPATQESPRTANIAGTSTPRVLRPSNKCPAPKRVCVRGPDSRPRDENSLPVQRDKGRDARVKKPRHILDL